MKNRRRCYRRAGLAARRQAANTLRKTSARIFTARRCRVIRIHTSSDLCTTICIYSSLLLASVGNCASRESLVNAKHTSTNVSAEWCISPWHDIKWQALADFGTSSVGGLMMVVRRFEQTRKYGRT
ncbi:unnamed protein product [Protopolystoma xenopodis]|uniref:Uncharacterized protein n=1 Tax=Protopolystoma xenopodis TaxID=117903 RepID=A0A448WJP0_9PLAT|nr:unnamed protein product [Protopolystoma xenopodis]